MTGRFDRWLAWILRYGSDRLGLSQVESLLVDIIARRTRTLPADEALRLARGLERDGENARALWEQWQAAEAAHTRTVGAVDLVFLG